MEKKSLRCWRCNKVIPVARAEFLIESGCNPNNYSCLEHSQTQRIKGIYLGENGTSEMKLCDKVYNDSVRSKFREAEETTEESGDDID